MISAAAVALAREVGHRRDRRLAAHPRDDVAGALAGRAAGAVGDRHEARLERLELGDRAPERELHGIVVGREELEREGAAAARRSETRPWSPSYPAPRRRLASVRSHGRTSRQDRSAAACVAGDAVQCRKWRSPVKTMAMPCSSAAAMTSSSRIAAARLDDRARRRPRRRRRGRRGTGRRRRWRARAADGPTRRPGPRRCAPSRRRFCWPAPMPTAWPSLASTMALERDRGARPARRARGRPTPRRSALTLGRRPTTATRSTSTGSGVCTSRPPSIGADVERRGRRAAAPSSTRRFFLAVSAAERVRARSRGRRRTSVNTGASASASAAVTAG